MADDARAWRPQAFGRRHARTLRDPIVEPSWDGARVLAHVKPPEPVEFVDTLGLAPDEDTAPLAEALTEAVRVGSCVLDGYLTYQATGRGPLSAPGFEELASAQTMAGRFLVGDAAGKLASPERRNAAWFASRERSARPPAPTPDGADTPLAFVAVDLLEIDGTSLLDVPLLERKRQLDSALEENLRVRKSPFLRLPLNSFLPSWRAAGFSGLAYKDPNGRYRPGEPNDGWVHAPMPRR